MFATTTELEGDFYTNYYQIVMNEWENTWNNHEWMNESVNDLSYSEMNELKMLFNLLSWWMRLNEKLNDNEGTNFEVKIEWKQNNICMILNNNLVWYIYLTWEVT